MDGWDKNFNANKVFSDTHNEFEAGHKYKNNNKMRCSRGANTPKDGKSSELDITTNFKHKNVKASQNEKPKRKFHLFSLIKHKLNLLANITKQDQVDATKQIKTITMTTPTMSSQFAEHLTSSPKHDKTKANDTQIVSNTWSNKKGITMKNYKVDNSSEVMTTTSKQHNIKGSTPSTPSGTNLTKSDKKQSSKVKSANTKMTTVSEHSKSFTPTPNASGTKPVTKSDKQIYDIEFQVSSTKDNQISKQATISNLDTFMKYQFVSKPDKNEDIYVERGLFDNESKKPKSDANKCVKPATVTNKLENAIRLQMVPTPDVNEVIYVEGVLDDKFQQSSTKNVDQISKQATTSNVDTFMRHQFESKPDKNEDIYVETGLYYDKYHKPTSDANQCLKQATATNKLENAIRQQMVPKPDVNEAIYVEEGALDDKTTIQNDNRMYPKTTRTVESNVFKSDDIDAVYVEDKANDYSALTQNQISVHPNMITTSTTETKVSKRDDDETVYVESGANNDSIYYSHSNKQREVTKPCKTEETTLKNIPITDIKLEKRDITLPPMKYYTAKDVAALEVIVDLAKNTQCFDERNDQDIDTRFEQSLRHPNKVDVTSAIQVHIAIPSDYQNNKRSIDPVKIRKVFSAKLSSPVDLEYQVRSFEHLAETTTQTEGLSPGMYLIVSNDSSVPKGQLALKPVASNKYFDKSIAKRASNATEKHNIETTSVANLAKVTLSRDFISVVNKHLAELYDTFNKLDGSTPKVKVKRAAKEKHDLFSWNAIKKLFGHDRVCDCKCRPNKTMCRGCAASDAVISELIFEFENLGQYMRDHCTEIQTFFWMNPSGGKKLKEAVHQIENHLKDYYKNVKNKCHGRPCETFVTYIDKRNYFKAINNDKNYIGWPMIKDLNSIAESLKYVTESNICYNESLKKEASKLMKAFNSCISDKQLNKRGSNDDYKRQKSVKNVYSLDNVNVNIICNPESSTKFSTDIFYKTSNYFLQNGKKNRIFDYTVDGYTDDKLKGFRNLFKRKKKKYHAFVLPDEGTKMTTLKTFGKREAKTNQIELLPLIADTGGSFWNDYIKRTVKVRMIGETKKLDQENHNHTNHLDEQSEISTKKFSPTETMKDELFESTIDTTKFAKHTMLSSSNVSDAEDQIGVDSLTNNIKELLKLFGSCTDVEDIKYMYTEETSTSPLVISKHRHKLKKAKTKKTTKTSIHGQKFKVTNANTITKSNNTLVTEKNSSLTKNNDQNNSVKETQPTTMAYASTIKSQLEAGVKKFLGKIQNATLRYKPFMSHTNKPTKETRGVRTPPPSKNMHNNNTTVKTNPTIVILNEYDEINHKDVDKESYTNTDKFKDLLLSIIQHETNKLNDEWLKVEAKRVVGTNSVADLMKTIKDNIFFEMTDSDTTTLAMKASTTVQYNIESNTEATLSTSNTSDSGGLDITETSLLDHESKASIENKNKTTAAPLVVTNGFLNRLLKKIGSMKTPRTNKNQKAVTQTHPSRSIEENESSANENSRARSHVDHTTSGLKMIVTQEKKQLENEAEGSPTDMENEIRNATNKEACDTQWNSKKLCDVRVTYHKILNLYHKLDHKDFENLAKNITCFKFMEAPAYFIVNPTRKQDESVTVASKSRRWDWIRNKRSLRSHFDYKHHSFNNIHKAEPNHAEFYEQNSNLDKANIHDNEDSTDSKSRIKNNDIDYEEFEKYDRDKYSIYRLRKKRRKRTVDRKPLDLGLDNLQPLKPGLNEVYAITGDSITMDCVTSKYSSQFATNHNQSSTLDNIFWEADRKDILEQDNVLVDGLTVSIGNVQPRNVGNYICRIGSRIQRSVRLSVFTLPSFIVISTPAYSANTNCSYADLNAVLNLGVEISKVACHDDHCTVRIEEPTCLKDMGTEQSKMKAAIVMKVDPHPGINCSVQCRRDLHSSLAKLHAANVPILSNIRVVLLDEGGNKTYVPSKAVGKPVITRRLRRKSIKRRPYQKLISETTSNDVSIVESCPAGYYLVTEQMICAPCPHNTRSSEGENICSVCPLGSRSGSGADKCRLVVSQLRRYDWWWYPPCGYFVACSGVVCGCGACVVLALLVHVTSRNSASTCAPRSAGNEKPKGRRACTTARAFSPRSRPLSPSRVILARFFKPSLSSARATDSQEMKFEQWKERNIPPPLPPIDFDM